MSTRLVFATLISAVLLSSYSSAIAAAIRPEVAGPLDEARVLANGGSEKARIEAKLNQAASVPNLNSDERHQIVVVRDYVISRVGQLSDHGGWHDWNANHPITSMPNYSRSLGYTGLR
jgi:hypothetical protein